MQLRPGQLVLLLAGPSGSGKTTVAGNIASVQGWRHISEDDVWKEIGHPPDQPRDDHEQVVVHDRVHELILQSLGDGKSVVVEFILFHKPPTPLFQYQAFLTDNGIPFATRVLRPSLETILQRAIQRGRPRDLEDLERFKQDALHQLDCVSYLDAESLIDTSAESLEASFDRHFRALVERGRSRSKD